MAKIFISHSWANNAEAWALRNWLVARGWDDLFLDIDSRRGLVSGQHWLDQLQENAQRCKAVLFVLSRDWLASKYCIAEFWEARKRERPLFAVVIDDTAVAEVPAEIRGVWQLVFLTKGSRFETFSVLPPLADAPAQQVSFSHEGLESLRRGLALAGLTSFEPESFPWPARGYEHEADSTTPRRPYRGLKPVDVPDAGVFFARDADLVRARDHLAGLRERGGRCLVVLLGASGSGKSSFLRAGLLPRLARDDHHFLPLPVFRPRGAALWGDDGLLAALERAHRQAELPVTRAELRKDLEEGGAAFLRRLADLRSAAARGLPEDAKPPTLVLPIDQAEELFTSVRGETGATEDGLFLDRLAEILRHGPEALVLVTIRSDAYEPLQTAEALAGVLQIPFNLPPLTAADYRSVIEGPARRASDAGRLLALEPELVRALLADTQGADALPLLGFTLERLYVEHGGDGTLTLADYGALGGVQGSIEAAVEETFVNPDATPRIPAGAAEREALLKRAFVPHLMGVNEANGEPVRRTARQEDLPEAAYGLIKRLIDHRLLVIDRRVLESGAGETVIEVAHEALLRRWPTLRRWHDEERAALEIQQEVDRASTAWSQNARGADWLAHRGAHLAEAEAVARRDDFAKIFEGVPRAYLDACRQTEDAARNAETRRLTRQRAMQRRVGVLLIAVAIVTLLGGWLVVTGRRNLEQQTARLILAYAKTAFEAGHYDRAMRLALVEGQGWLAQPSVDAEQLLRSAARLSRLEAQLTKDKDSEYSLHKDAMSSVSFAPDGRRIVTASADGNVQLWSRVEDGTWQSVVLKGHQESVNSASFSPNGSLIITASMDGTVRIWSQREDNAWSSVVLESHPEPVFSASFSPDGAHIVTSSRIARVWSHVQGDVWSSISLEGHQDKVFSASYAPDGTRILTASLDGTVRVWEQAEGGAWSSIVLERRRGSIRSAFFAWSGMHVVTTSSDGGFRLWSEGSAGHWNNMVLSGNDGITFAAASPDSAHIVTAEGNRVRVWSQGDEDDTWDSYALEGHQKQVRSISFSPDSARVVGASLDGTARVWNISWQWGPGNWDSTEPLSLLEKVCREKLHGSWTTVKDPKTGRTVERIAERLLTADDIRAAPILAGREGEDVCAPFLEPRPWWARLAFWR